MVGLCNMPQWIISCRLWSCQKSNWSYSILDKNIEERNILMCILTPLGVNFKSGVIGKKHHEISVPSQLQCLQSAPPGMEKCSKAAKRSRSVSVSLTEKFIVVRQGQGHIHGWGWRNVTVIFFLPPLLLCFFFLIDYDYIKFEESVFHPKHHPSLSACHIADSLNKNC